MKERLWVIIVNYRTAALTVECLRSLAAQVDDLGGGQVLVVDNDSGDGSVQYIEQEIGNNGWMDWAKVLPMPHNGGFAYGNNAGMRSALAAGESADLILLLNPDTVARPGALRELIGFMVSHPAAGIAGSRIENAQGSVEASAHQVPSPLSELDAGAQLGALSRLLAGRVVTPPVRDCRHVCDWVSGACLMIRRGVVDDIGMMDEGYFLYFEEVDYCCRARRAGWECWYVPEARVMHLEGAATGIRQQARRRPAYWFDSRRRFFVKEYGVLGLMWADILWSVGRASLAARRALRLGGRRSEPLPRRYALDLLWGDLRALTSGRLSRARLREAA